MRDRNRIKKFCDEFAEIWETRFCDLRFGQLIVNFFSWILSEGKTSDIFFPEEDKMIEWFREYSTPKENKDEK